MKLFLREIFLLSRPYFQSSEKWHILLMLSGMSALIALNIFMDYQLSVWQKVFFDALQVLDQDAIYKNLEYFFVLLCFLILTISFLFYLQNIFSNHWRIWMTNYYVENWLKDKNYYWVQKNIYSIDSPDQRICEDIQLYCYLVLFIFSMVLRSILSLIVFIGLLWSLSEPMHLGSYKAHGGYVWIAILYAFIASMITHYIGKRLSILQYEHQKREASLRSAMMKIRETSTVVALWNAEKYQLKFLRNFLLNVGDIVTQTIRQQRNLNFFINGYTNLNSMLGRFIALPQFIAGRIQLGDLMQIGAAFGSVQMALSIFVQNYENVAELKSVMKRLVELQACPRSMAERNQSIKRCFHAYDYLEISELNVSLPNGTSLLKNLNFKIKPGERVYIVGHAGSGKTSLQCALAGLWPHGHGYINLPEHAKILFIPEQSYIPPGTMRQILAFPNVALDIPDDVLQDMLVSCMLERFYEELDSNQPWGQVLSQSELQRINFFRILLHKPDFVIADNLYGALSCAITMELLIECQRYLPDLTWIVMGTDQEDFSFFTRQIPLKLNTIMQKQPIV